MSARTNLLPDTLVRRFEHRRQIRKWAPTWIVVAVLLMAGHAALQYRVDQANATMRELQTCTAPLCEVEKRIQRAKSEASENEKLLARIAPLEQANAPLGLLQVVVESCNSRSGAIQIDSYRMDETAGVPAASKAGVALRGAPRKRLAITGSADTDVAVSAFVQRLRGNGAFSRVNLESSQATGATVSPRRTFQIMCET